MPSFDMLAFDADDTLWHNERLYNQTQQRFAELLAQYHPPEWISDRLNQTEARNIAHFGYGIKSFGLSMIETAVELSEGRLTGQDVQALIDLIKAMLHAKIDLLDGVGETIPRLAAHHRLMLITKGDLLDQEAKIARSGLGSYFQFVEVVSEKTPAAYERVLGRYQIAPERFLMVGNSLRSDILPVLELGGSAVYIPYETTWLHESAEAPAAGQPGYYALENIGQIPALLDRLEQQTG